MKAVIAGHLSGAQLRGPGYVLGTIQQTWPSFGRGPRPAASGGGEYERRLIDFMSYPSTPDLEHRVLILRGGIGTGKTTSLRYAWVNRKRCHECSPTDVCGREPLAIWLDFFDLDPARERPRDEDGLTVAEWAEGVAEGDQDDQRDDPDRVWRYVAARLADLVPGASPAQSGEEVVSFWPWLFSMRSLVKPESLYRMVQAEGPWLADPQANRGVLNERRALFFETGGLRDQAYYYLLLHRFLREKSKGRCHLLVLDNVDSLGPKEQGAALDFAADAAVVLSARVLIAMRPFSVTLNSSATSLMEVVDHCSPEPICVLSNRVTQLRVVGEPVLHEHCRTLAQRIEAQGHMRSIVEATCGLGVRFLLRNFYNTLLCPLVVADDAGVSNLAGWSTDDFYQAYFCGEEQPQLMYTENFCNILDATGAQRCGLLSNIKLRILQHLVRSQDGALSIRDLVIDLRRFGYDDATIAGALSSLLRKKTPLIWSDSAVKYSPGELDRNDGIMLAPLGRGYYQYAIADPLYIRECVMSLDGERAQSLAEQIARIVRALKQLAASDLAEICRYRDEGTAYYYQRTYGHAGCISKFVWDRVGPRLRSLAKDLPTAVDEMYGEYIWYKLRDFLECRPA